MDAITAATPQLQAQADQKSAEEKALATKEKNLRDHIATLGARINALNKKLGEARANSQVTEQSYQQRQAELAELKQNLARVKGENATTAEAIEAQKKEAAEIESRIAAVATALQNEAAVPKSQ